MIRYLMAALLLRAVDAGATVGLVLLCTSTPGVGDPIRTAGLLGAALTAPHLVGPLTSRWLDRATDPRRVIAVAGVSYAAALTAAVLLLGRAPFALVAGLVAAAGLCGPMLTGGLSSLLPDLRAAAATRRRSSLDATTYGVTASAGPALVTIAAQLFTPLLALIVLVTSAVLGALLTLALPTEPRSARGDQASGLRQVAAAIWRRPALRRISVLTWVSAFSAAGLLLLGIGRLNGLAVGQGGWVAAGFGVGVLLGGLALVLRPPRICADLGLSWSSVALVPLGVVAVVTDGSALLIAAFVGMGLLTAVQATLSLSGRAEHSTADDRGGVFMGVSGTKVAFSSAGTAVAGLLFGAAPVVVVITFVAPLVVVSGWSLIDRHRERGQSPIRPSRRPVFDL